MKPREVERYLRHPVMASWIREQGFRLDAPPFLSGAIEARKLMESLPVRKEALANLTKGYNGGIYNGPKFSRTYVDDPQHGVPFVGSSDMLLADLSHLPLLSKKQACSDRLSFLRLEKGMTLISCSGTIGRTVYVREDMVGMWSSQHVMKVVPDPDRIPPGYLYAFLSSKFGQALVTGGTYGAIIQHIEPDHIAKAPVPRLGAAVETRAHALVERAGFLRTEASHLLEKAVGATLEVWGSQDLDLGSQRPHPDLQVVCTGALGRGCRLDASFYSSIASESDRCLEDIGRRMAILRVGGVAEDVFETPRFGRIGVDDPAFGVPFLSISDLVRIDPRSDSYISRRQAETTGAIVRQGWIVLPRVGQLQGVFGTAVLIPAQLDGVAVSDNNLRISVKDRIDGAYLWSALSTRIGYVQIIRRACGTSIPYLDAGRVADIPVPWPAQPDRTRIGEVVLSAMRMRTEASKGEREAIDLVEAAIEGYA